MSRRRLTAIVGAGVAIAIAVGAYVAIEETAPRSDAANEPALVSGIEGMLGLRLESLLAGRVPGLAAPGAEEEAVAISPDAPTQVTAPRVERDRPSVYRGDVRDLPHVAPQGHPLRAELRPPSELIAKPGAPTDLAAQTAVPKAPAPAAVVSEGISRLASLSPYSPPDTVIDVGPRHVIEATNISWAIYDKTTRQKLADNSFDGLFTGTGTACDDGNRGDPIVLYDTIADRWILSDFAWSNDLTGPMYECLAVSINGDPVTGGWRFYAFEMGQSPAGVSPATRNYLPDYPKLGVWPDGIYLTLNMFALGTGGYQWSNGRVVALDRTAMESGGAAEAITIDLPSTSTSLLPANARVQTGLPAAGTPNYIAEISSDSSLRVWKFHADWANPESSWVSSLANNSPTNVDVTPFSLAPSESPTPGVPIDTLGDRPMMQNQYTSLGGDESIWLTHAVDSGGSASVRWYELSVTGDTIATSPAQQATWNPGGGLNRFMSSIAVNRFGDVALGYSTANSTTNPGIRYAGRLAGDPASTFTLGEQIMTTGTGSPTFSTRWGDYSTMTLDPSDGCTFWYANEYYADTQASDDWHTALGSVTYPTCIAPSLLTAPLAFALGSATVGSTVQSTSGSWNGMRIAYGYQWQRNTGAGWSAIADANAATHVLVDADAGASVRCVVTATNPIGTASGLSNEIIVTLPQTPAPPAAASTPTPTPLARISGLSVRRPTLASLANGLRVAFTLPRRAQVTIVVRARGKIVGRITRTVAAGRRTLRPLIARKWRLNARRGDVLVVRLTGRTTTGQALRPTSIRTTLR